MSQTRHEREAMKQLAAKRDTNLGGTLLGKRMVHKSVKHYDRRKLRLMDRNGRD